MSSVSVFCCLKGCLDGFNFNETTKHTSILSPIQLDTSFMGYEVVIVKRGQRVCGAGAVLSNAPLAQSKSYFEVKVQQAGSWSVGLATRQTDLSLTLGGMDEFSWALCSDHIFRHNKQEEHKLNLSSKEGVQSIQEGDVIGVAFDHIQLKFFVNGTELDYSMTNIKGTIYPALYDDGAILDIILENFCHTPPQGFEKIMLEQSLL
ncbi:SPRY domain-containing protein 7 isoform X2 [Dendroctonus ponderosae]|uniref:SPRY domain-containing protein 7 n=1 Tax=Dendroctonus ponderosae TaxID=77166 RepID=A0AAR5PF60_DENPD|nr:SPRY domain-containing protein 7 isoform X2 [Dendroctonus ponderosae]